MEHGVRELWFVTTNDNVDEARRLKPSIPTIGSYDIPVRNELVLARSPQRPTRRQDT